MIKIRRADINRLKGKLNVAQDNLRWLDTEPSAAARWENYMTACEAIDQLVGLVVKINRATVMTGTSDHELEVCDGSGQ